MNLFFYLIGVAVIAGDRITKVWVQKNMFLGESFPVIPNIFHLTYIINKGAAFGLLMNQRLLFLAIVVVLLGGVVYARHRIRRGGHIMQSGVAMLVGGALGNAWDRAFGGGVIDFFDFRIWPIFNVADIAICIGVAFIIYAVWHHDISIK